MISVMIPTRGRPHLLLSSVHSLLGRTSGETEIEILAAVDQDDETTVDLADNSVLFDRTLIFPERHGYTHLHEYYNAMAEAAYGTWLYQWNDDAVMLTDAWDLLVMDQQPHYVLQTVRRTRFPLVPKVWVDHIGHYSLDRHCDTWWDEISKALGRSVGIPIDGAHAVPRDQTAEEREYDVPGLLAKRALIDEDVTKIRTLL